MIVTSPYKKVNNTSFNKHNYLLVSPSYEINHKIQATPNSICNQYPF